MNASPNRSSAGRLDVVPYSADLWSRIGHDWTSLAERRGDASVFLSAPWIEMWIDVFGPRVRPEALIWRDEREQPIAACLVSVRREKRGPFTLRRAYVNATGEDRVASEHNMVLAATGAPDVHAELVRYLRAHADALVLFGFRSDAADAIRARWPASGVFEGYPSEDHFISLTELRDKATPYLMALSRNTREKIRRSIRLYEEQLGAPSVDVAKSPEEALAWFADLRRLHAAKWEALGQRGAFAEPDALEFHERLMKRYAGRLNAGDAFRVDVVRLRFGDSAVGLLYNLIQNGVVAFYQSGLRYTEDNRLKPGLVTHAFAVQHYLDAGAAEYDFLAGERDAVQYKRSLSSGQRPLMWLEYSLPNLKMRLIHRIRAWRESKRGACARFTKATSTACRRC